jgi:hypothetical protein
LRLFVASLSGKEKVGPDGNGHQQTDTEANAENMEIDHEN